MSNPYVNQLLFGHTKQTVTPEYVKSLEANMLTTEWLAKRNSLSIETNSPNSQKDPFVSDRPEFFEKLRNIDTQCKAKPKEYEEIPENFVRRSVVKRPETPYPSREKQGNSLFWAIYGYENPAEEFLRPSAANVEIETRLKIVASLKQNPKRLKDTNSKMTLESTQALLGSMLTAREDKLEFCIAYSVYFGKHILVVYPNTYQLFSPSTTAEIEDDDHVIILYASKKQKIVYSAEPNPTKQMADAIIHTKLTVLKAQSNYKIPELESVANKLNIATKTAEGKRRKKEDVYNEIRLAIHNDMHFLDGPIR